MGIKEVILYCSQCMNSPCSLAFITYTGHVELGPLTRARDLFTQPFKEACDSRSQQVPSTTLETCGSYVCMHLK